MFEMRRRNRWREWVFGKQRRRWFFRLKWFRRYPPPPGDCPELHSRMLTPSKQIHYFCLCFSRVAQDLTSLTVKSLECQIFGGSGCQSRAVAPCGRRSLGPPVCVVLVCLSASWHCPRRANGFELNQLLLHEGEFQV